MEDAGNITQQNKSPGAGYLTPKVVAEVFGAGFLDVKRCDAFIFALLHGDVTRCPGCGAVVRGGALQSLCGGRRVRCAACGKFFSALTGTFLSGTHLSNREIVLICLLLGLGVPDKEIARIVKISAESVRLWRLKFAAQEEINRGGDIG